MNRFFGIKEHVMQFYSYSMRRVNHRLKQSIAQSYLNCYKFIFLFIVNIGKSLILHRINANLLTSNNASFPCNYAELHNEKSGTFVVLNHSKNN